MGDFYEVLGVPKTASTAEIRKAYMTLARERHPDRFSDPAEKARAQELFQMTTEAFNTLANEKSRSQYDQDLSKPRPTTPEDMAADAFSRGLAELEAQRPSAAAELFQQAAHFAPEEARYHAALGRALARDPHTAREAAQSLEQATRLDPKDARSHGELALLFARQGLTIRARREAQAALDIAPGDPEIVRLHAQISAASAPGAAPNQGPPRRRP